MTTAWRGHTFVIPRVSNERLRYVLNYDSSTGVFTWNVRSGPRIRVGMVAGSIQKRGSINIIIDKVAYSAHRLAWQYIHGKWPEFQIDHKNLNRSDNRIDNLRQATRSQNIANRRVLPSNQLGIKGVGISSRSVRKPQRYRARIRINGTLIHLGYFSTPGLAHDAYAKAAVKYFGEFARSA